MMSQGKTMKIAVIGLGFVGLPLCMRFVRRGFSVLGLDTDAKKVRALRAGRSYISHIPAEGIGEAIARGDLEASTDFSRVAEVECVLICVPTPLGRYREPDLSFVLNTARSIAPHLASGVLVVLESTTYPGTTDGPLREVLEAGSAMTAGSDFHLAYSPEREDPANPESGMERTPKVVGGMTGKCLQKAADLYRPVAKSVVPVSSCRVAEATKLLENIFRAVNIALVNELKSVFQAMDIDVWEVIEAARTKPFGYMPFYPGPGLGGHCIPIDPFYLTWKAREYGQHTRFIELAGEINSAMPVYVVDRVAEALNADAKAVNGSRVLLIGLAYKPNVDDMRESPTLRLMEILRLRGAGVEYYDPFIPVIPPSREHMEWAGKSSVTWNRETVESFDLVLISTAHDDLSYDELGQWAAGIVDTRNVMSGVGEVRARVWKA